MMTGWYLSQDFATDTPGRQVFLAPGPDDRRLANGLSPWIQGRMVTLPGRYWHRLLIAVADTDPEAADLLDQWSGSADPDDPGEYRPASEQVAQIRQSVDLVSGRLLRGEVVSDQELVELGDYTRNDMAGMLNAVLLVVIEAQKHGAPFCAWPE